MLEIAVPAGPVTYVVHVKHRVSPGLGATIRPSVAGQPLVVAPYVPDSVGEALRLQGVNYVDTAGNAYLSSPGLLVDVRGRRNPTIARPGDRGRPLRAFKASGLRVIFALLTDPDAISASYRDIAYLTGTSVGTVHWVMKELAEVGHITEGNPRRLHRSRDLLNRWVEAYILDLHPRLTLGIFDAEDAAWWTTADETMLATGSQWGGEIAVQRIYPRLRPGRAIVYASAMPSKLATEYRFRKSEAGGNVEVRRRFWHDSRDRPEIVVPSPLVYADLAASGDPRQLEAAAYLREHDALLQHLDRS